MERWKSNEIENGEMEKDQENDSDKIVTQSNQIERRK